MNSKIGRLVIALCVMVIVCVVGWATGTINADNLAMVLGLGAMGVATVLDDELTALTAQVKANTDAEDSAKLILDAIPAKIKAAVDAALAAGATPTQLQAITNLGTALKAHADALAASVAANT